MKIGLKRAAVQHVVGDKAGMIHMGGENPAGGLLTGLRTSGAGWQFDEHVAVWIARQF